jgi:predicted nucleotidyltransferase
MSVISADVRVETPGRDTGGTMPPVARGDEVQMASQPRVSGGLDTAGPRAVRRSEFSIDRDEVIATLRAHEAELRGRGVAHAALFGSLARGEATSSSDIDILVDLAPDARIGLFGYVSLIQFLEDLFPLPIDVANRRSLKPVVRPSIERDALYAF